MEGGGRLRPVLRRRGASDLEAARKMVSTEERHALERAEELRREAEELYKTASEQAGGTGGAGDVAGSEEQVEALRQRADAAESELEQLRARCAELESLEAAAERADDGSPTPGP